MSDIAIQALIDSAKTATPGDLVTWAELKAILEALKNQVSLTDLSPASGQIPKWNGTAWVAADDDTGSGGTFSAPATLTDTDPDDIEFFRYEPSNYNTVYGGYGKASYFSGGWARFNGVNSSGRPNVVGTMWGYNHSMGGGRADSAEASFGFRTETHFEIGGGPLFEFHLPEFTDEAGVVHRIWSWYLRKDGTVPAGIRAEMEGFQLDKWGNSAVTWGTWAPAGLFTAAVTGTGGASIILSNTAWDQDNNFKITTTEERTTVGRPDSANLTTNYVDFVDNVKIGADTEATNKRLFTYGFTDMINKFTGVPALYVRQKSSYASIAMFYNDTTLSFDFTKTGQFIGNTSAPATPTGGGVIYVESGALKYKGSSGTITTLGVA